MYTLKRNKICCIILLLALSSVPLLLYGGEYVYNVSHGEKPCFLDGNETTELLFLLSAWRNATQRHGVLTWLETGTLLGARRLGTVLPWDHDADVAYLAKDVLKVNKDVRRDLVALGITVNNADKVIQLRYNGGTMDIFVYGTYMELRNQTNADPLLLTRVFYRNSEFFERTYADIDNRHLFPLQSCTLNAQQFTCPASIDIILQRRYPYTFALPFPVPFKLQCYWPSNILKLLFAINK